MFFNIVRILLSTVETYKLYCLNDLKASFFLCLINPETVVHFSHNADEKHHCICLTVLSLNHQPVCTVLSNYSLRYLKFKTPSAWAADGI